MITNKYTWKLEEDYLERVISEIKSQINDKTYSVENFKKEAIELQKEMWDEVKCAPTDLFDLEDAAQIWQYESEISIRANKYKFSNERLNSLKSILSRPYFGRIDFREDGYKNAERIYIGLHNVIIETLEFLVYDWRAPISSMFYDYEIGPCNYECPDGLINGEMLLKRQYKIENGKIVYMFDSSLNINDEVLQKILGNSTDNRMNTIVTSIQREQNAVIRNIQDKILIVHGPAGSGKTSIALHRAAYLLYKYRDKIKSENILVFSPNHVFEDYISTVLPELGEENILRSTFADFFTSMFWGECQIETSNQQMEYMLSDYSEQIRLKSIKFKSSLQFLKMLKKYVRYINNELNMEFNDLTYEGYKIISGKEIFELFRNKYNDLPYIKRLEKLRQRLLYIVEQNKELREINLIDSYRNKFITKKEKLQEDKKSKIIYEHIKNEIIQMTTYDILSLYKNLFKNIEIYYNYSLSQDNRDVKTFAHYTIKQMEQGIINYEDFAPIVYLKISLGASMDTKSIKHIIIDEAQDYTVIQYEIFKMAFENSNMTILGDINQCINVHMNIGDFRFISDIFIENSRTLSLTKSYRCSKEISDFCRQILDSPINSQQLNRHGNKPKIVKVNEDALIDRISYDINVLKNKNHGLIAVICKTVRQCESIYGKLKSHVEVSLISNHNEEYQGSVIIIPSYLAKGLEFDGVLVISAEDTDYTKTEDRKMLYTVCTRALHELYLYYFNNLSNIISGIEEEFYEMIQDR